MKIVLPSVVRQNQIGREKHLGGPLLFCLGLICSLLAGHKMAVGHHRSWLHILGFTAITVVIVYVAVDIEYPCAGLIRLNSADQMLVHLCEGMK